MADVPLYSDLWAPLVPEEEYQRNLERSRRAAAASAARWRRAHPLPEPLPPMYGHPEPRVFDWLMVRFAEIAAEGRLPDSRIRREYDARAMWNGIVWDLERDFPSVPRPEGYEPGYEPKLTPAHYVARLRAVVHPVLTTPRLHIATPQPTATADPTTAAAAADHDPESPQSAPAPVSGSGFDERPLRDQPVLADISPGVAIILRGLPDAKEEAIELCRSANAWIKEPEAWGSLTLAERLEAVAMRPEAWRAARADLTAPTSAPAQPSQAAGPPQARASQRLDEAVAADRAATAPPEAAAERPSANRAPRTRRS